MGVDYLTCHKCEENFPDCGYYVTCKTCGTIWCSDECANDDGYIEEHCTKYGASGYDELMETREYRKCEHNYCSDTCEFYVGDCCKMCRGEDYEDYELLKKALELLNMNREELINKMKSK